MTTEISQPAAPRDGARAGIELNGLNTIAESERHGRARDLFWPWFAANVSVLGLGYGSFILGFGISFWQATLVGVIGIVDLVRALRLRRAGRQARLGADDGAEPGGVRGARQPRAGGDLLGADRRMGDRPHGAGGARDGDRVRRARARFGRRHEDRRPRGRGGPDRRRRHRGLRPDHAAAGLDHRDHRGAHRGLHRPDGAEDRPHGRRVARRRVPAGRDRRARVRDDRLRPRLGERRRRLLAVPAPLDPQRRRLLVDDVRRLDRADRPRRLRPAARRILAEAEQGDRRRPDRRPHHDPAGLVPHPLRDRRDPRPRRRRRPRHLLVRPRPAVGRHPDPALRRRGRRRGRDDRRRDLRRVLRARLRVAVRGVPRHPRRADRGLVRGVPRRLRAPAPRLLGRRPARPARPLRRRAGRADPARRRRAPCSAGAS